MCSNWWNNINIVGIVFLVGLIDLPGQVWNVDSSITLSGKIQIVSYSFWVESEELNDSLEKIVGLTHIILSVVFWAACGGESNTSWSFNVKHVSIMVP